MAPLRGWGPKGKRLTGYAPHGRWRTMRNECRDFPGGLAL